MARFVTYLFCFLLSAAAANAQVQSVNIPVPLINQQNPEWCWAASAQMILAFLGIPNTQNQCTLVELAHGHPPGSCCLNSQACTEPGTTQDIQNLIGAGGTITQMNNAPNLWQLAQILSAGRPIIAHLQLPGGGHFIVIRGLVWQPGQMGLVPMVIINDPMQTQPIFYPVANLANIWDVAIYLQ